MLTTETMRRYIEKPLLSRSYLDIARNAYFSLEALREVLESYGICDKRLWRSETGQYVLYTGEGMDLVFEEENGEVRLSSRCRNVVFRNGMIVVDSRTFEELKYYIQIEENKRRDEERGRGLKPGSLL